MSTGPERSQRSGRRTRIDDVQTWIDACVKSLPAKNIPLVEATGRILADEVRAPSDLPPEARSAIDGFALRAEDTVGASAYNPLPFRSWLTAAEMPAGHAVRVNAGDTIPHGADAVVAWDRVTDDGLSWSVVEAVGAGEWVEQMGSHVRRGAVLAPAGRRLRPDDIGLLALAGIKEVPVVRRARVRCLLVGRNLRATPDAGGPLLRALIERDGGVPDEQRRIDGTVPSIRDAMTAPGADIVLVCRGSGPGSDDTAAAALEEVGELIAHGVALRPAETVGTGRTSSVIPVFLLPGAPAACLWGYELVAGRAIRRLGGRNPELPFPSRMMITARKIVSEIGMLDVCPVRCRSDGTVLPLPSYAETGLAAATQSDGFVLVPDESEGHPQGAAVMVYLYDALGENLNAQVAPEP